MWCFITKQKQVKMSELKKKFEKVTDLFKRLLYYDLWGMDKASVPSWLRPFIAPVRLLYMIGHDFVQKHTVTKAAALSYTTVLGLIPLLIIAVSFSKGFLQEQAEEIIPTVIDRAVESVAPHLNTVPVGEERDRLKKSAKEVAVERLSGILMKLDARKLGVYGVLPLILVAYFLLQTIENTLNDIWNIKRGRPFWQQFLQYWVCITLLPAIILITMGLTGRHLFIYWEDLDRFAGHLLFYVGPYLILWVGFTIFYKVVPNTHVRLLPALIGGIVGGTLWQINNMLSFMYVSRAIRMQTLYGGIAIVPIFLLSLYFAWLIILFGSHVAFAAQNFRLGHMSYALTGNS